MKKILILLALVMVSIIGFSQGQRYVLVEHFTNSTSSNVVSLNNNFYQNIYNVSSNAQVMHHITYHIPLASDANSFNCGLYLDAALDNAGMAAEQFNPVTSVPTAFLNGNELPTSSDLVSQLQFTNAAFPPTSPLYFTEVGMVENTPGNYTVFAFVKTDGNVPDGNYKIKIAITEKGVAYNGGNGENFHRNVMRKMIPEPNGYEGTDFVPAPDGNIAVYPFTNVTLNSEWNVDSLCVLAWVIDAVTYDVINSGSSHDAQPLEVSVDNSGTNGVNCFGDCDGAISLDVDGGTPPYSYTWIPNQGNVEDLVNLCAGVYSVTVTDANGETSSANNINITNPQPLAITTQILNDENSYCLGFAAITLTGGTAPITTFWKDANGNLISTNQATLTNACAGFYQFSAIDNNGCTLVDTITILNNIGNLDCPGQVTNVTCSGFNNGSIDVSLYGVTGDAEYSWSGPLGFNAIVQDVFNLIGGEYQLTVTDDLGAVCNATFFVNDPQEISINPTVTDDYDELCNGTALANPLGGSPPFVVAWDPNDANVIGLSFVNICAGEYDVLITDINECTTTTTFTIEENSSLLSINVTDTSSILCNNDNNGEISFTISGGFPDNSGGSPYAVGWAILNDDGTTTPLPQYENLQSVNNLPAANYIVTVLDSGEVNTEILTYEVINPAPLVLNVDVCLNDANMLGQATANVTGGTPPYQYQWNSGANNNPATNLSFGLYSVTVLDDNVCQVANTNIFVSQNDPTCVVDISDDFAIANGIKIYPTNFTDNITIEMTSNEVNSFEFFLISSDGKMVSYEKVENFNATYNIAIDQNLPKGMYFASIHAKNGTATHKLIKL